MSQGINTAAERLVACDVCLQIQRIDNSARRWRCVRCGHGLVHAASPARRILALSLASAALILYVPAISLPILTVDRLGNRHSSSIVSGTWELLLHGEYVVGVIVLLFSIILPLLKLIGLLELTAWQLLGSHSRRWIYRLVELIGRWGMLDVLLLALLVMLIKVGDLVSFQFGPAAVLFAGCVLLNLAASAAFDHHSIWQDER